MNKFTTNSAITSLFGRRDRGINEGDRRLFLSTELDEIRMYNSQGYLTTGRMRTEVIAIYPPDPESLTKVVYGKETYYDDKGAETHHAFLMYYLVNTVEGWKIYNIVY